MQKQHLLKVHFGTTLLSNINTKASKRHHIQCTISTFQMQIRLHGGRWIRATFVRIYHILQSLNTMQPNTKMHTRYIRKEQIYYFQKSILVYIFNNLMKKTS